MTPSSSARHRLVVVVIGVLTMMSVAGTASAQTHAARGHARHTAHHKHHRHHGHAHHAPHARRGHHEHARRHAHADHAAHARHAARHGGLPPMHTWHRDVARAFAGLPGYLQSRAASGERLAIVLGIDNVALATRYDWPRAVPPTLRLVRRARALGYAVFFVTGRSERNARSLAGPLRRAGFAFEGICGRAHGLRIAGGKLRCRQSLTARGYTITANISTHHQAYVGGYYERAVRLPSYGGRLS
ncbi:hypothetical protein SAMN04487968_107179 [Nocardioides terrae]|uniref:HAD superfamily, subfamily IIIB (Acid phosphatase) n=1 Tax=Nocardioides terrae TaxID=574651 RepID=A0A1I1JVQ8_9ACTN|nr:hypothetical protein [Nocardioides terrae]SFC52769.1 hypothetical protein SAMN04487968_107179 [Nocardioides terrae]